MSSSHKVEIVPVKLEPHPNADSLSIVNVYGFTVCVRTDDWTNREIGAYIQPDSVVPNTPQFEFLGGNNRIRVKKLRGVVSMGMLIPAPEGSKIGDDVAELLGITHYEPPIKFPPNSNKGHESEPAPIGVYAPKYDIENLLRYHHLFEIGEPVIVTEKIHGANARFVYHDGRIWCGSKNEWKKQIDGNIWWEALKQNPNVEQFCKCYPGNVVYAEVFGNVQSLRYGANAGQYFIRVFDIMRKDNGDWLDYETLTDCAKDYDFKLAPNFGIHAFSMEKMRELAEGNTTIAGANHIREGIVIRPIVERTTTEIGRLQLKLISNEYLEKN